MRRLCPFKFAHRFDGGRPPSAKEQALHRVSHLTAQLQPRVDAAPLRAAPFGSVHSPSCFPAGTCRRQNGWVCKQFFRGGEMGGFATHQVPRGQVVVLYGWVCICVQLWRSPCKRASRASAPQNRASTHHGHAIDGALCAGIASEARAPAAGRGRLVDRPCLPRTSRVYAALAGRLLILLTPPQPTAR